MTGWRELARQLLEREESESCREPGKMQGFVPIVPIVPGAVAHFVEHETPADWHRLLSRMDLTLLPERIGELRWRQILEDARWLAGAHGRAGASLGWTASDLFGWDGQDGWGGLAVRLEGSRRVLLTEDVGHWHVEDGIGRLWRRTLAPKPPIWAIPLTRQARSEGENRGRPADG